MFPPEIVAPTFVWNDATEGVVGWKVLLRFGGEGDVLHFATTEPSWRPSEADWAEIKRRSTERDAEVAIVGVGRRDAVASAATVRIRTSTDPVGDSIFYREVPLPFLDVVRDPSRIRWRFGTIDSEESPPIVLENLPVCGNCHSFSRDGGVLGLDVDYGNDKGAYAVLPVSKEMVLDDEKIITWSDYRRNDGDATYGLLSQISPDGRYVISTVKDRAVFVATPDIQFSQLFFPVKGILVFHDRETGEFKPLPGADDPAYVQSNPTWSPDGQYVVFARSKAYHKASAADPRGVLLNEKDVPEFVERRRAVQVRPVPSPLQRRQGGPGGADRRRLAQWHEQLLREILAGRKVDRVLQGEELHAAAAGQRAVHHPGRRRRGAAAAREHAADEFLAQLRRPTASGSSSRRRPTRLTRSCS